jgi:hypothetical protein
MSEKGRIKHLVTALQQSGFYSSELPVPGRVDANIQMALEAFAKYKGNDPKKVSRVVNALRNISPSIFRGFAKYCNQVTPALTTAVNLFIAANNNYGVQGVPAIHEEDLSSLYAG